MHEQIDIWLVGNTGLRNPSRIQEGFSVFASTLANAPYTIFCATPFLPSNMMLLISFVTTLLLYNGSANTSLFWVCPLRGTVLPSLNIIVQLKNALINSSVLTCVFLMILCSAIYILATYLIIVLFVTT